jgi:glycerol transport system permease protein
VGTRHQNFVAYGFLVPALAVMVLCAVLPMSFVAFYSVHDTFGGNSFVWVGLDWYRQVLTSPEFFSALMRSLAFSLLVLIVEVPLGLYIALRLPAKGLMPSVYVVLMAIPLLAPTVTVGHLWKALTLPNAGLIYEALGWLGMHFNINNPAVTWIILVLMDIWHWTGLVVLLCLAGLRAIPVDYYRAARIDGASRWQVFRHIQLPKLRLVLLIGILLRFMDSFMIYADAYVINRGGPGVSSTFLSHELVQTATVQFDLGEAGAMSIIYFGIILCVSWVLFALIEPRKLGNTIGSAR